MRANSAVGLTLGETTSKRNGYDCRSMQLFFLHVTSRAVGKATWLLVVWSAFSLASAADSWKRFNSQHYAIYTNISKREADSIGRHMDLIFAEYTRRFGSFRKRFEGAMPLYLLRTRQQYINLMRSFGFDASASGGMFFFSPKASGLATWIEGVPMSRTLETLQHEGFHQFAHAYIGSDLPVWINEGLAEYFGDGLIVRNRMKVGMTSQRRLGIIQDAIRHHKVIDFDQLLGTTSDQWLQNLQMDASRGYLQYQQSWSMVYFLIHGDNGKYRKAFEQYLLLVNNGHASRQAFVMAFGTEDTTSFRRRWQRYVLALKPDELATAIARMQFLGRGLAFLKQEAKPIPNSMAALRRALQTFGFRVIWMNHGVQEIIQAKDESVYRFLRHNGAHGTFKMLEAKSNHLLPRIVAAGLRPEPTLVWFSDSKGQLEFRFQYR